MLYKFKSKATGDLILLEPQGRQFLILIGKAVEPKGIIEADQMPEAIKAFATSGENRRTATGGCCGTGQSPWANASQIRGHQLATKNQAHHRHAGPLPQSRSSNGVGRVGEPPVPSAHTLGGVGRIKCIGPAGRWTHERTQFV